MFRLCGYVRYLFEAAEPVYCKACGVPVYLYMLLSIKLPYNTIIVALLHVQCIARRYLISISASHPRVLYYEDEDASDSDQTSFACCAYSFLQISRYQSFTEFCSPVYGMYSFRQRSHTRSLYAIYKVQHRSSKQSARRM